MKYFICLILSIGAFGKINHKITYNQCPIQTSDQFAVEVIEEFQKTKSLLSLKKMIDRKKLEEKFFMSDYNITYSPMLKELKIAVKCPRVSAKVNIYDSLNGEVKYSQLLLSDGSLYNPTYEHALRASHILKGRLPVLSIEEKMLDKQRQEDVAIVIDKLDQDLKQSLIEVVYNSEKRMSMILNIKKRVPASVFLGRGFWPEKIKKLNKIFDHYSQVRYGPVKINLENPQKVVVRF